MPAAAQSPARLVEAVISAPLGLRQSTDPWQHLQALRRGQGPLEPVLSAILQGDQPLTTELLAALLARLDRPAVEALLRGPLATDLTPLLEAAQRELPSLADETAIKRSWLEPLLALPRSCELLQVLGYFRDPRVAAALRAHLELLTPGDCQQLRQQQLLPLLGRQRRSEDGPFLMEQALAPGAAAWRRAALEALAVGLSAWSPAPLAAALTQLARDLDPALASQAVDLLSRLPQAQQHLRALSSAELDPAVAERLARRLQRSALVLVVHGRQGGLIPAVLQQFAAELEQRRGAPVVLQALTAGDPELDGRFWLAARRAGALTVVPLLLLPGDHARSDVPAIASRWRQQAQSEAGAAVAVRRRPFLGSWPAWQQLLARQLSTQAQGRALLWLHHPLQGPLAQRFLRHLAEVLGAPGLPAAYGDPQASLAAQPLRPGLLAPLTLAPNRLSESLKMVEWAPPAEVLPPLLELPAVRDFLLAELEALP